MKRGEACCAGVLIHTRVSSGSIAIMADRPPLLVALSEAIGVELDSPAGNAAAIVFWAVVWGFISMISLRWLTPRGLPSVPDEKRWHVR